MVTKTHSRNGNAKQVAQTDNARLPNPYAGANKADLLFLWDIVKDAMQASTPTNHPDRFRISQMVESVRDANGDAEKGESCEQMLAALTHLHSMPKHLARKLLGGWAPQSIVVNREESLAAFNHCPLLPALTLRIGPHDIRHPHAQFENVSDDDRFLVRFSVQAGSDKGQVLEALEWLRSEIDANWESLIAGEPGAV